MITEHAPAFQQLRTFAASLRLRVSADAEGYPIISGKYDQIEWYHTEAKYLAVYTARRLTRGKLLALSGIIRHQIGDEEVRVLFPAERLPEVARVVGARKRRSLAPAAARKRSGLSTVRASASRQDRV